MPERLRLGDPIAFSAHAIDPQVGRYEYDVRGEVTARHEGGFYGEVLEVDEVTRGETIIKTAHASGLIHKLGRLLNWDGHPFPSQVSEAAATLDYLSQKIARGFIPAATGVYTPDAHGVGLLPQYGYVQDIEKLYGRPPSYRYGMQEYERIMAARRAISALGFELGNTNWAGQTHPDNVFGLQNLWIGRDGNVILVDQLPGIRHKGSFLGLKFGFLRFQQEMRNQLGHGNIVYNEIDTDLHRKALGRDPRFAGVEPRIHAFLDAYDDVRVQYEGERKRTRFEQNVAALVTLGILKKEPETVRDWIGAAAGTISREGGEVLAGIGQKIRNNTIARIVAEKGYAKLFFSGLSVLEDARRHGVVSEQEWRDVKSLVFGEDGQLTQEQRRRVRNYVSLWSTYLVSSTVFNTLGGAAFAVSEARYPGDHVLAGSLGLLFATVLPASFRYLSAKPFTWVTKQNSDIIRSLAPIPMIGSIGAVPAQMAANPELKNATTDYWGLTVRGLAAKVSGIMPWGGWGTDFEASIMRKLFEKQPVIERRFGLPKFVQSEDQSTIANARTGEPSEPEILSGTP